MSFDINPLGPQTHLRQLEREVRRQHLFESAAEGQSDAAQSAARPVASWVASLTNLFIAPRHAS